MAPHRPLARGRLARPWGADTKRLQTDPFGKTLYAPYEDEDRKIVAEVEAIAKARGATMAQVALAWLLRKREVSAPILGVTKLAQLTDAIGAVELELSDEEAARLEAPYTVRAIAGFQ